ncbi:MAG: spore maturation protein [Firmicutes bacterium]|nr:spore maturation protein [Bacillota bacterium]
MGILTTVSHLIIPFLIAFIPLYAFIKKIPVFEVFTKGAAEGVGTAIRILPFLLGMLVAIAVFRASGMADIFCSIMKPLTDLFGIPPEVLPLAAMRPFSGGASLGLAAELIQTYGPDSFIGRLASVMQGSTDTTFYILAVYFGSVAITRYRYAVAVGLTADIVSFISSFAVCLLLFG